MRSEIGQIQPEGHTPNPGFWGAWSTENQNLMARHWRGPPSFRHGHRSDTVANDFAGKDARGEPDALRSCLHTVRTRIFTRQEHRSNTTLFLIVSAIDGAHSSFANLRHDTVMLKNLADHNTLLFRHILGCTSGISQRTVSFHASACYISETYQDVGLLACCRQLANYPETLVLYRTRPARLRKSTCVPTGRVRYSCLKEAAGDERPMQIQWGCGDEKDSGKR
jgi:hypothetical protein